MYLLDTNICSYFISRRFDGVVAAFKNKNPKDLYISSIVAGELAYGVAHSQYVQRNTAALELFLANMQMLPWDDHIKWIYGTEKSRLRKLGTPTGELDLLLGCQALYLGFTLVTNNIKHFDRIQGLKLENWV
jgi:tRNA(fMet)-specific endonuclease VapC